MKLKQLLCLLAFLLLAGCAAKPAARPAVETARIAVMVGSTNELYAEKNYPDAALSLFNNYVDSVAALKAGKVDYAMMDYATALNFAKYHSELEVLPQKLTDEKTAIAMRKENPELNAQINELMNRYLADGTIDEMIAHWIREDGSAYEIVEVPKHENAPVLRAAVTSTLEPRCFVQNGELTGMVIELVDRLAYDLGMVAEYQDMQFSALMASLQSGKSDLAPAVYPTPERMEKVDFTEPYFPNPQVLVVRKQS